MAWRPGLLASEYWRSMPRKARVAFLLSVFLIFLPAGLLSGDIPHLGADSVPHVVVSAILSGATAVGWILAMGRWRIGVPIILAIQIAVPMLLGHIFGPPGPPLAGIALQSRLGADVEVTTLAIVLGFGCFSYLFRTEGARHARVDAEIDLARTIHRHLVPRIEQRIGPFEIRGVSSPSGEVGGDLIDVVESPDQWTAFIADVSGHGVAAGVLMGMLKSAARTELRDRASLESLLRTLNAVLFELKTPTMFATFAGVQWTDGALRFTVAGHLPILHYRAATKDVRDLQIAQLPLAMFDDTVFTSAPATCEPGDVFVILTDGLTEVFDRHDRELGLEGVRAILTAAADASLAAIEARLMTTVRAHGPQLDDQTLLLIRVA